MLVDGARRGLAATRDALATFARTTIPSIRRFADAARVQRSATEGDDLTSDEGSGPLEDEQRDLLARFEELVRRSKGQ